MGLSQQVIRLLPTHVAVRNAQLCRMHWLKAEPNDDQLSLRRQFSEIRKALRESECQNKGRVSPVNTAGGPTRTCCNRFSVVTLSSKKTQITITSVFHFAHGADLVSSPLSKKRADGRIDAFTPSPGPGSFHFCHRKEEMPETSGGSSS